MRLIFFKDCLKCVSLRACDTRFIPVSCKQPIIVMEKNKMKTIKKIENAVLVEA